MITLKTINREIYDLEDGEFNERTIGTLADLYIVRDHMAAAYGEQEDSQADQYQTTRNEPFDSAPNNDAGANDDMYTVDMQSFDATTPAPYEADGHPVLTLAMAEEWVSNMVNADGTTGGHWSIDKAKQIMAAKNIQEDPVRFWVALCATYSDLCEAFKKNNVGNHLSMYVDTAIAFWLHDEDAVEDKLAAYYTNVVKHE